MAIDIQRYVAMSIAGLWFLPHSIHEIHKRHVTFYKPLPPSNMRKISQTLELARNIP